MNGPRRIGSLCSGYGGLGLAELVVFGGELAWHAEVDPDASAVLAHRFPEVSNLGDRPLHMGSGRRGRRFI